MRSGRLSLYDGKAWYAGANGYWWPSRGTSTRSDGIAVPSGYSLAFGASGVNPSYGPSERWFAFSLRCLSTVLDMEEYAQAGAKKELLGSCFESTLCHITMLCDM